MCIRDRTRTVENILQIRQQIWWRRQRVDDEVRSRLVTRYHRGLRFHRPRIWSRVDAVVHRGVVPRGWSHHRVVDQMDEISMVWTILLVTDHGSVGQTERLTPLTRDDHAVNTCLLYTSDAA